MNQKLLIVLFFTLLYNGVTYSSPVGEQVSSTILPEKKLPDIASVTEDIKKKIESSTIVNSTDHVVSGIQNATSIPQGSDISNTQKTTIISNPIDENTIVSPSPGIVKNGNQDSISQNMSKVADSKTSSQIIGNKGANSSHDVPTDKNSTSTIVSSTSAAVAPTTATPVKTTIKPTISTVAPTPALTNKVVTGQNTPAPAEEKHFDGPSFIGGIVLTIGLTAIGFIAFKYYKSGKIDMNYRTL